LSLSEKGSRFASRQLPECQMSHRVRSYHAEKWLSEKKSNEEQNNKQCMYVDVVIEKINDDCDELFSYYIVPSLIESWAETTRELCYYHYHENIVHSLN
jgi:hypothetical protein